MKKSLLVAAALSMSLAVTSSQAQITAADYVVQVSATAQETPPQLTLRWIKDPRAQSYKVFRRALGVIGNWGTSHSIPAGDTQYVDNTVVAGTRYEYKVEEAALSDSAYKAWGFVAGGVDVPMPADKGSVILLVDGNHAAALSQELTQLSEDLYGEGWHVIRHDIPRGTSVPQVKDLIVADYNADPQRVRSVFIIGHVPVPYSGDIAPDGHYPGSGNHLGAWPADMFYGQTDGDWTDDIVNDVTAFRDENKNQPGDGKYDQDQLPSGATMQLEVGRADFANLPSFPTSELELLRAYLKRDHAFRTGSFTAPERALIDINFGILAGYDVPGHDAYRNLPPLVGTKNMLNYHSLSSGPSWFDVIDTAECLWAYGCGAGSFNSCSGVGVTSQFATAGAKAVFYMLFGSFFGDWDSQDNLLRAPLATNYGLISTWVSRPYWFFHPLGAGETFGYCTKITQNNSGSIFKDGSGHIGTSSDYVWGLSEQGVHIALMGDPTLRMRYLSGIPTNLSASVSNGQVTLNWSGASGAGFNVYRAPSVSGAFVKINSAVLTSPSFVDATPLADSNIYQVRAASIVSTPSGSIVNESGGVTQGVKVITSGVAETPVAAALTISQDAQRVTIRVNSDRDVAARLSIVDITGRELRVLGDKLGQGTFSYSLDRKELSAGVYFAKITSAAGAHVERFLVAR